MVPVFVVVKPNSLNEIIHINALCFCQVVGGHPNKGGLWLVYIEVRHLKGLLVSAPEGLGILFKKKNGRSGCIVILRYFHVILRS